MVALWREGRGYAASISGTLLVGLKRARRLRFCAVAARRNVRLRRGGTRLLPHSDPLGASARGEGLAWGWGTASRFSFAADRRPRIRASRREREPRLERPRADPAGSCGRPRSGSIAL